MVGRCFVKRVAAACSGNHRANASRGRTTATLPGVVSVASPVPRALARNQRELLPPLPVAPGLLSPLNYYIIMVRRGNAVKEIFGAGQLANSNSRASVKIRPARRRRKARLYLIPCETSHTSAANSAANSARATSTSRRRYHGLAGVPPPPPDPASPAVPRDRSFPRVRGHALASPSGPSPCPADIRAAAVAARRRPLLDGTMGRTSDHCPNVSWCMASPHGPSFSLTNSLQWRQSAEQASPRMDVWLCTFLIHVAACILNGEICVRSGPGLLTSSTPRRSPRPTISSIHRRCSGRRRRGCLPRDRSLQRAVEWRTSLVRSDLLAACESLSMIFARRAGGCRSSPIQTTAS